ncbi:MAG: hypothetical protein ACR2QM_17990 [Longimicrobiales bacterium]
MSRLICTLVVGGLIWGLAASAPAAAQDADLSFGTQLRITGATVLRGGPASPPTVYPVELEGNVVGMRGDTLLFETGNEPVYWIPLASGYPLVERRGTVRELGRTMLIAAAITGGAGATFAWGLHDQCRIDPDIEELGISGTCPDKGTAGGAALKGFLVGAGIGVSAGLILGRFARRSTWVPVPLQEIQYREGPVGPEFALRVR